MSPEQKTVLNLSLAGLLGGTGVGLLRNMMKHQKLLSRQADNAEHLEDPDEALMKAAAEHFGFLEKAGLFENALAGGLGVTGGVAGAFVGNELVDRLYNHLRKKEMQRMLADAEEGYTDALLREAEQEKAARMPDGVELVEWLGLASLPLAALGSGVFTHRLLNRAFSPDPANSGVPNLEVSDLPAIQRRRDNEEDDSQAALGKSASLLSDPEEAFCGLLGTVCAFTKASSLRNFVKAVALGRGPELEKASRAHGMEAALDLAKGAGDYAVSQRAFELAKIRCVKTAHWRPVLTLLTAAELNEAAPGQVKIARLIPEKDQDILCTIMIDHHKLARAVAFDAWDGEPDGEVKRLSDRELIKVCDAYCKVATADDIPRDSSIPMYDADAGQPSQDSCPQDSTEKPDAVAQPPIDIIDMALTKEDDNGAVPMMAGADSQTLSLSDL